MKLRALVLIAMFVATSTVRASLIGDTVTVDFVSPLVGQSSTTTVVAQAGDSDLISYDFGLGVGTLVTVNIEASSIHFNFINHDLSWASGEKFVFNDLQFLSPDGVVAGVTFDTNIAGFGPSRVGYTENSITVDMSSLNTFAPKVLNLDIQSRSVPEPASLALFGLGLFGMVAAYRAKRKQVPVL